MFVVALSMVFSSRLALAQRGGFGASVGGIMIDADGIVKNANAGEIDRLRFLREEALQQVPGDLAKPQELRKVSLRRLEAEITRLRAAGEKLSDEVRYLAGLQRIRYVFVYPEQNDIVLAGFGEGWKIDARGNVVGQSTGRPVLLLDDLVMALRTARTSAEGGISCSIDPTVEGMQRLREFLKTNNLAGANAQTASHTVEQLMGPQLITLHGVPPTSHFARVMVAADYRMKRLGMNFEPAPVAGLPSYVQMIRPSSSGLQNITPRWWLVPDYNPLLTDGQGLAWEIRGSKVKCLTEETYFAENGSRSDAGKPNPVAQKWADNMTSRYDELSLKEPIFGQLRNCMELAVVATLILREDLTIKAHYKLPFWYDATQMPTDEFLAPKQTDTQANFTRKGNNWIITASGGVQLQPWTIVDKSEKSESLAPIHAAAAAKEAARWWWN